MTGLPRSIIKKYGVSKKAWAVFRSTKHSNKRRVVSMAKRRKHRGVKSFFKRHKSGLGLTGVIVGGAAYGAARQYAAAALQPLTSKLPMGNYADNVVMGVLSWALAKGKIPLVNKIPMTREIGKAGLYIESAFLGQELLGQVAPGVNQGGSW